MTPRSSRFLLHCLFPLLLLLVSMGGCRKSDAERAAEERAKFEARIRDSVYLLPYRSLKLVARAGGSEQVPQDVRDAWSSLERSLAQVKALPETPVTPMDKARTAGLMLGVGVELYRVQRAMGSHDEDEFPLLRDRFGGDASEWPMPPGYDAGMEHLFLGGSWAWLTVALQKTQAPPVELALYELARARPSAGWPGPLRTAVRGGWGVAFLSEGYHYAAEEELTAYLDELPTLPAESFQFSSPHGFSMEQRRQGLLAMGYFLRAANRQSLGREEPALEDLTRALDALASMGVENELTWWGSALVHARRERYAEAAASLDKLAQSPYLDEPTREELRGNARQLREHSGRVSLLRQERAVWILSRALLARAGGLEGLLVPMLGQERAQRLLSTVSSVERLLRGVTGTKREDVVRASEGVLDQARQAGREGLERLKQGLDAATKKATAGATPP